MAKASKKPSKTKEISLLEAAMIGNATASMGKLDAASEVPGKAASKKAGKKSLLGMAIKGATTPSMGKSELGKNAAEKTPGKK